jgi:hypothetical protein
LPRALKPSCDAAPAQPGQRVVQRRADFGGHFVDLLQLFVAQDADVLERGGAGNRTKAETLSGPGSRKEGCMLSGNGVLGLVV